MEMQTIPTPKLLHKALGLAPTDAFTQDYMIHKAVAVGVLRGEHIQ